eukprot:403351260
MDSSSETRNQLLENPLRLIHDQFKLHISQLNFQTQTFNSQDLKIPQLVENILGIQDQSEPNLELIPSLNSCENVQDIQNLNGKLVKFECMIQDMYEEEYFMSVLLPLQTHDTNSTIDSSNSQNTQNPLAGSLLYKYYSNLTSEQMNTFDTQTIDQRFAQERGNLLGITVPNVNSWVKNQNSQEKPKSCLIKVYDDQVRGFKLNDSVTFIGILEVQKQAGGVAQSANGDEEMKIDEGSMYAGADQGFEGLSNGIPNEANLPHLHAITFRRDLTLNTNQLLRKSDVTQQTIVQHSNDIADARNKFIAIAKLILNNDSVAAEYLLLNLISKVHTRKDGLVLGNVSINISNITTPQVKQLTRLIEAISPFSMYLPFTIDSLQNKILTPRKNYDTNQLEPGLLQMLDNTFVIIDETQLKEGQIKEQGIQNIKALATLIEQQVVVYDFMYSQMEMPINSGVLVCSEGRSMMKNTQQVVLKNADPSFVFDSDKFNQVLNDQETLNQLRRFLLAVNTYSEITFQEYQIPAEVSEYCQNIFIEMRKAEMETFGAVKTNADTFHTLLTYARLIAASEGKLGLENAMFDKARSLEQQRQERIAQKQ